MAMLPLATSHVGWGCLQSQTPKLTDPIKCPPVGGVVSTFNDDIGDRTVLGMIATASDS